MPKPVKARDKILPRIVSINHLTQYHIPEVRHVHTSTPNVTKHVWYETVCKISFIIFFTDKMPVRVDHEGASQQAMNCRKVYKIRSYLIFYLWCYLTLIYT
jgi:hypothetical protein